MVTTNGTATITVERVDGHCTVNWRVRCPEHGEIPYVRNGVAYSYPFEVEATQAAARHQRDAHGQPTTEVA